MLDHMRLYRKRCMEMLIYIYIYIYIMTACGYTEKDGPLNVYINIYIYIWMR